MSDIGRLTDGQRELQRLRDGGFTGPEIQQYQADQTAQLRAGGFQEAEVQAYWGTPPPEPTARMDRMAAYGAPEPPTAEHPQGRPATTTWEAMEAGWQSSVIGLLWRGQVPNLEVDPEQTPIIGQIASAMVQAGIDLPSIVLGGRMAGPAASMGKIAHGSAAGALGMGLPQLERSLLIDHYQNGDYTSAEDFGVRFWKAFKEATGASAEGAAFGPAGVLGRIVEPVAGKLAGGAATVVAGAAGAEGVRAALGGDVSVNSFIVNAASMLGLHAAGHYVGERFVPSDGAKHVAENMMDIYARTGITPEEQAHRAASDPALRAEIIGRNADGDTVSPEFNVSSVAEELPDYKPRINAHSIADEHAADVSAAETAAHVAAEARQRRGGGGHHDTDVDFFIDQERSANYAKAHGISVHDVVSPAGAIGLYQVMPDTARRFGFDPNKLHDPAVNRAAAEAFHADLVKRFPGDPEAQVVAYIAGPNKAYTWIAHGRRDGTLGPQTRAYLARARARLGLPGDGPDEAAQEQYRLEDHRATRDADWVPPEPPREPPEPPGGEAETEPPGERPRRLASDVMRLNEDSLGSIIRDQYAPDQARDPWYRRMNPMRIIAAFKSELSNVHLTEEASDQLNVKDMMRQRYASVERVGSFIDRGPVDAITLEHKAGPSYKDAFRAVKEDGGNMEGFRDYRNAARTVELFGRGIDSGIDIEVAKRYVALAKGKYARGAALLGRMKDGVVDYGRDSGLYSERGAQAMKDLNREHITMRRQVDASYVPPGARPHTRFGKVKKIEGSERLLVDQDVADLDNMTNMIGRADHNRAVVSFVEAWKRGEIAEVKVELDKEATAEMRRIADKTLTGEVLDENGRPIPDRAAQAAKVEGALGRAEQKLAGNKFVVYRDGRPEVYRYDGDPEVFRLLTFPWPEKHSGVFNLAASVAKFMRTGVVSTITFMERVFIRNDLEQFVIGKDAGAPFMDFTRGVMDAIRLGPMYDEVRAKGGIGSSIADIDRRYIKTQAYDVFRTRGVASRVWNVVNPFGWPEAAARIQRIHSAAKNIGAYKRLTAKGMPSIKAAMESRTMYIDNAEPLTSAYVNGWSRLTVFMRTSVKSIEQMGDAWKTRKATLMMRGIGIITVPTVANYIMNMIADQSLPEKDRYAKVPQWQRDLFWVLPPIGGIRLMIPRPYTVGFVFGTVPERILDRLVSHDPRAFRKWGDIFMQQFGFPVMPAIATPILEGLTNTGFSGAPLVPRSLAEASGYMQYKPDTTETAKAIARFLSPEVGLLSRLDIGWEVSPIVLDNYVKGWSGSLPFQVLKALESPWHYDGRPWTVSDLPLVGSFIARNPGGGAQPIQDFYTEYDRVVAAHRDLALALEHGDMSEIQDTLRLKAFLTLTDVTKALRNQSVAIRAIEANRRLTDDEKQKYEDGLYASMITVAQSGLQMIDALDKAEQ